jgi:DNA-binding MarR family transcriptional regulator
MEKRDLHILRLMGEIDRDGNSSQRELSRRLNISVGLVNTILRRLQDKGYFMAKTMPRNRVRYSLTREGRARKSKLTVEYLRYAANFYKDIKSLLLKRFMEMEKGNIRSILFYGAGEVAELAYLYLQLTNLRLVGVIDDEEKGKDFFGLRIADCAHIKRMNWDGILLTRLEGTDQDIRNLLERGVTPERIVAL